MRRGRCFVCIRLALEQLCVPDDLESMRRVGADSRRRITAGMSMRSIRRAGPWAVAVVAIVGMTGCGGAIDLCEDIYETCEIDEDCNSAALPPGLCIDDRSVGRICAVTLGGVWSP